MRKLSGLFVLLLLSVILVACGTEDEEPEPTAAPTMVVESEPTVDAGVGIPGTPEIDVTEESSPVTSPVASPEGMVSTPVVVDEATPAMSAAATPDAVLESSPVATPAPVVMADVPATPDSAASPAATPVATPAATPLVSDAPEATPDASEGAGSPPPAAVVPAGTPAATQLLGMVVLNGTENEAYILTDQGCVGLGQYADLQDGRQVVVRDETGTIISVTELDVSREGDGCAWDFVVQVPESDFYSVSIPMTFERVFTKAQVNENGGEVVIELP